MVMPDIYVMAESTELSERAQQIARQWSLPYTDNADSGLVLLCRHQQLVLRQLDEPELGDVLVDFTSGVMNYRREHGGGRKEAIAKAIGIKGEYIPHVIDGTAGLGRDAFVLASLGCKVDMIERSPVVAALLSDGLKRAAEDSELGQWVPQLLQLYHGISYQLLSQWQGEQPDVVYLDPMFPHRKKSALVKKEMRLFQQLLGPDEDADSLLVPARALAKKRVVVKRPNSAPFLDQAKPSMSIKGKKHRFDVYITI